MEMVRREAGHGRRAQQLQGRPMERQGERRAERAVRQHAASVQPACSQRDVLEALLRRDRTATATATRTSHTS
jgi:hypothetical protein